LVVIHCNRLSASHFQPYNEPHPKAVPAKPFHGRKSVRQFLSGYFLQQKKRAALIKQHALLFRFVNFTILKNFFYSLSPFLLFSHHSFQS
jgi:hypothetical protein